MSTLEHEKKAVSGDLSRDQDLAEPGPEEAKAEDAPAEEAEEDASTRDEGDSGEGDESSPAAGEDDEPSTPTGEDAEGNKIPPDETPPRDVPTILEREAQPLQRGRAFDSPFGPLPVRSLAAMATLVAVGAVVYLLMWALLGTFGLLIGWIPAAALGLWAAREAGHRTG